MKKNYVQPIASLTACSEYDVLTLSDPRGMFVAWNELEELE